MFGFTFRDVKIDYEDVGLIMKM